jgi:hypothetical protein
VDHSQRLLQVMRHGKQQDAALRAENAGSQGVSYALFQPIVELIIRFDFRCCRCECRSPAICQQEPEEVVVTLEIRPTASPPLQSPVMSPGPPVRLVDNHSVHLGSRLKGAGVTQDPGGRS